jgi:hypothetical protein
MTKKLLLCFCVALISISIFSGIVLASDINNAKYLVKVQIVNSSNSTQVNKPMTFAMSTNDTIMADMLNASATNVAMLTSPAGSDVAFMPGYGANPWAFMLTTINSNATNYYYTYMKDVTGGTIRYFPGATGMAVPDTLAELGTSFFIQIRNFYINTDNGTGKYIINHDSGTNGLSVYVSPTNSGTIIVKNNASVDKYVYLNNVPSGHYIDLIVALGGGILSLEIDGAVSTNASGAFDNSNAT